LFWHAEIPRSSGHPELYAWDGLNTKQIKAGSSAIKQMALIEIAAHAQGAASGTLQVLERKREEAPQCRGI
jgi:hypothetical protein